MIEKVVEEIRKYVARKFYGRVELYFQNGKITHFRRVTSEEILEPRELKELPDDN